MSELSELLGESLLAGSSGETIQTSSLEGHYIGLYFSAHWCPPCKKFTPRLATFYTKYGRENKEKKLEVVFVSSDKSEDEFKEYYRSMPWKALPFESPLRVKLGQKFKVEGIPTLVIIDPNGVVLTKSGVEAVMANDIGSLFPLPLWDHLAGTKVYDNKGVELPIETIRQSNEIIGFYFSASWCPPCRAFTPVLAAAYNKLRSEGKNFEVIFASSDRDQASYTSYFNSMPWKGLKLQSPMKEHLSARFGVEGLPTLVLVDKTGKIVSKNGRALVSDDLASYPWNVKKPIEKLTGATAEYVNDGAVCLIAVDEKHEKYMETLLPVASEFVRTWEAKDDYPLSFLLVPQTDLGSRLCAFLNLKRLPALAIINLPEGEKYVPAAPADEITAASFKSFISAYLGDKSGLVKKGPKD